VIIGTRSSAKAEATCEAVRSKVEGANVSARETGTPEGLSAAAEGVEVIIATGAAGIQLLSTEQRSEIGSLKVAIDLNAVPPVGIEGVEVFDKAVEQDGVFCYGAIGVGGTKMKIHKAAVQKLFTANDLLLDTAAVFEIGQNL
jgi:hypothetical protein